MQLKEVFKLFKKAVKGEESDYTSGSLKRALFLLSVPMILEMVMESLFAIVDVFFVARVSNHAVATVGMTEGVLMLIESVAIGIAMAATALVARRVGEKKEKEASDVAVQAILLGLIVSAITGIAAFYYAEDILRLMGGEPALIEEGKNYTRVILSFNVILMLLFVLNGIFRAAGNPAIAMRTLWLSNGLNIILDPIFIFGLGPITGMGVTGAAIATCTGRGVGVLYQLYVLWSGGSLIKIYREYLRPNLKLLWKLVRVSAGGAGQFLISTASWIFLIKILAEFGSTTLAGYTIGLRIIIFSILPSWGLATATATLVGQNLGAGDSDRAEKTVWMAARYNMYFLLFVSIIFILGSNYVTSWFSSDPAVVKEASLCLVILCFGYVFFAYQMTVNQAFNGSGDTYTPTLISFVFMWLFQIPVAYLTAIHWGYGSMGVYLTIIATNVLASIASVLIFRKGKWKAVVV